ncbi:MAG: hypothetical protein JZU65_19420 [Chlorobium sp.]|jgi:hypothetical protein|nr:hypothetical protein [Chlorobium sp.]
MIKFVDQRRLELERCIEAQKKHEKIITTPERIDAQTYILVRQGKDKAKAAEKFKKAWKEFREYDNKHAEPFLSK